MEKNEKIFLELLFDKYNNWVEPEDKQAFIDKLIYVWIKWDEMDDKLELKTKFVELFRPKRIKKTFKESKFNALWLMYWPKFIS